MAYKSFIIPGLITIIFLWMVLVEESAFGLKSDADSFPKKHVVEISALKFEPEQLNAAIGDTVVWVNKDIVPHTATATDEKWDFDYIADGDKSTVLIVQETGNQPYFCRYHPSMKGVIIVRE